MSVRITLFVLLMMSAPTFAGVVFEFDLVNKTSGESEPDRLNAAVDGNSIRMDVKGPHGANADMIYLGDKSEMLAVDHDSQTFVLIDQPTIARISAQLNAVEAQLQEMLKDVPPDQRAAFEEMLRQQMPQGAQAAAEPVVEIRETGERAEKHGYAATRFEFYRDGKHEKDFWITDWDQVEGGREAASAFQNMAGFIEALQAALPDFARSPAVGSHAYEHFDELDGFPVVTIEYADDGSVANESYLRSSKITELEPGSFDPPAGYARKTLVE